MRRMPWTAYLWPGLPQITQEGRWTALLVAVGAAALLNGTVLATYIWSDWIAPELRIICWVCVGIAWTVSAGFSAWLHRRQESLRNGPEGDLFQQALDDYLKGNWFEAEQTLGRVLRQNERDLEARLMMASLLLHTKRFDDATRQLNLLARIDGAHRWAMEIHREGELLAEARRYTITSVNLENP
jgi:hypothetical protein